MNEITLELDCVDPQEGPWELEGLGELGAVVVEIVNPHGPGGGNPVVHVTGSAGALTAWLVAEYLGGGKVLDEALELLRPVPQGAIVSEMITLPAGG